MTSPQGMSEFQETTMKKGGTNDPRTAGARPMDDPKGQTPTPGQGMSAEEYLESLRGTSADIKAWEIASSVFSEPSHGKDELWRLILLAITRAEAAARADERVKARNEALTECANDDAAYAASCSDDLMADAWRSSAHRHLIKLMLSEAPPVEPSEGEGT